MLIVMDVSAAEVKAIEKAGLLEHWLEPAMSLGVYWSKLLQDYPDHPLTKMWHHCESSHAVQPHGDEAQVFQQSWMVKNWMLELRKYRTRSMVSRLLLYTFPAKHYVVEDGVNLTLQTLHDAIVKRFNMMAEEGLELDAGKALLVGNSPNRF